MNSQQSIADSPASTTVLQSSAIQVPASPLTSFVIAGRARANPQPRTAASRRKDRSGRAWEREFHNEDIPSRNTGGEANPAPLPVVMREEKEKPPEKSLKDQPPNDPQQKDSLPQDPQPHETPLFEVPSQYAADARLLNRAVKKRWKIDELAKEAITAKIIHRAVKTQDDRFLVRAGEFLLKAEKQNQDDEFAAMRRDSSPHVTMQQQNNVHIYLPDNGRGDAVISR